MITLDPKKHINPFQFFLVTNKKELPRIIIRTTLYNLGVMGEIGMSFFLGKTVDALQTHSANLHISIILLMVALVFHEIAYRSGHVLEVITHAHIHERVKKALFAYTSKLSFGYFADRFAGQISHQISTAANALQRMEEMIVNQFINNFWMLLVSAFALGSVYRPLGVALAIWFIFFIFGVRFFAQKITRHAENYAREESNTTGTLVDIYTNSATVKVYSEDFDRSRLNPQVDKEYKSELSLGKWSVLTYAYQGLSAVILGIMIFVISAHGYNLGIVSVGGIIIIAGLSLKIIDSVYATGHSISSFLRDKGECSQALKDIIVPVTITDGEEKDLIGDVVALNYNNVTFSYNQQKNILEDFSLTIPQKQRLGIVGLSGAGKTTMMNLLLRFFDPQKGTITLNNVDISKIPQDFLRSHISFISQDTSLFHTTITDNIKYGSPKATEEEIMMAAKKAYADEFIQALPNKYDTIVGERGVKLSGGQRQRIAIARAMLKNSPLFLLDEATSALDSDSEAKVQEALKILMNNKTVITIAHRLSTLQFMDRIIYIENGKVIEDGTHEQLIAKGGKYATLWSMQAGGFLPKEISYENKF
jgi:ATP-binding cassette subfamily B protein